MDAVPTLDVTQAWESNQLAHDRPVLCCRFSPCGLYVVAGAQDENLIRWELATGTKTLLTGHAGWVHALAFHPTQSRLLSGDLYGAIRCWDYTAAQPTPLWTVEAAHQNWILAAAFTQDGERWITAGTDGVIRLWKTTDGTPAGELRGHDTEIYSLAVHPNGTLVSGDLMGRVVVWNLQTLTRERTIDAHLLHTRKEDFLADVGGVRSLAFNPDGTQLAAGGMTDIESNAFCPGKPAVLVFDFASGELKQTLRPKSKSDGPVKGLVYLTVDQLAAQGENLNAVSALEFFSSSKPEPLHAIVRESGYGLSLHPDGLRLAIAGYVPKGRGGNGREAKDPSEYVSNEGVVAIYSLHEKPTLPNK